MAFKTDLEAKSTEKSTAIAVRRLRCWLEGKQHKELELPLELHKITKREAPQLLKHFILKFERQVKKTKAKNTSQARCKLTAMVCNVYSFSRRKCQMTNLSSVHSLAPTVTVNTANNKNMQYSIAVSLD